MKRRRVERLAIEFEFQQAQRAIVTQGPYLALDPAQPELRWIDGEVRALCHDGALRLLEFELDGQLRDAAAFHARYGGNALVLGNGQP